MPKNKNQDNPEVEERRLRRRSANTGITGGSDLAVAPAGFGGGGDGGTGFDRAAGYDKSMQTGEVINPSHFKSRLEWQEYYDALPQEFKRNYREMRGANEKARNNYLSFGGDFNKLGIKNVKEEGQAAYRRMAMHNLDKSFSYDWEKGVKYNVATSDDNVYMKPQPITPDDWAEKAEIDRYGATPEGFARRMQDSTRNTLNKWSGTNLANDPNTGKIHRDPATGKLVAIGNSGQTIYFDDFGNALDASGNQTGINYATGGWGDLGGVGVLPKAGANPATGGGPVNPYTPDSGNYAQEVTRGKANYSGWGNTYGPGTSGSGITLPAGTALPPTPVAPASITAPSGMGTLAAPISASPTTGFPSNVAASPSSSPMLTGSPAPTAPMSPNKMQMGAPMGNQSTNPFSAPGVKTAIRPAPGGRRPIKMNMGFGGIVR